MNEEILKFICWLTGHDQETVKQMYNDYSLSPQAKSIPMQLPVGVPKPNQLNEQTLWQTCPKCNGQGWMSKPSWITGDTNEWTSTSAMHVCDICWGAKIIQTPKSL